MSARYININDRIIVEISNDAASKDLKYDITTNSHTNRNSFYVSYEEDSNSNRDNGAERLDAPTSNRWLYLDVDRFVSGTGISSRINVQPIIPLRFNRIRIHILSGYTFDDSNGFVLQSYIKDIRSNQVNLLNFAFLRDFPNETISFNPEPLYINSKYYNRYIELDMLSPDSLINDANFQFMVNELSTLKLDKNSLVYFDFHNIQRTEEDDTYLITDNLIQRSLTVTDKYKYFGLNLKEVGDYFEYHATFKNGFPTEFINNMSQVGRFWVINHKLEVFEQVGMQMIKTSEIERIQRDSFNRVLKFRPIVENAAIAYSFTIKYTATFTDTNTNEQFYRVASLSKLNPKKYGETLMRLNTDSFANLNVYHKSPVNVVNNFQAIEAGQTQTLVVNHYLKTVTQDNPTMQIEPFTNVYSFEFNDSIAHGFEFFLSFVSDDEEKIYVPDIEEENTETKLFFKIPEKTAMQVRTFSNRSYYIIGVNANGESTVISKGLFNV